MIQILALCSLALLGIGLPALAQTPGFDQQREGIAHGTVTTLEYDSKIVGIKRKLRVYTPPNFRKEEKLPVLYLLHGIGGNEAGWQGAGAVDAILDNLYADKKAVRMLVVMPNGRASAEPPPADPFAGNPFADYARFEQELIQDVIPFIATQFSVMPERENRALAGLSMGGGQSLNFGLAHPEAFAWVGGFSSAPNTKPAAELAQAAGKANLKFLWVSCGDRDNLMNISLSLHNALTEKKIPHVWYVDKGGHDWPVWRNDFHQFAQRLFQEKQPPAPVSPGVLATDANGKPQPPAAAARPANQPPPVVSPEVATDRRVTFRIFAPRAESVRLVSSDLPNLFQGAPMKKDERGVWEVALGPALPGAYRYSFNIDGVTVLDPRNPATSESVGNSSSLVTVPGSEWMDAKNVPHGAVASVTYHSTVLGRARRMHIYTPPGYEKGENTYPVFYLLHGAGDSDDSWTSVGRANFILDNLIAAGKAKPMIVVMPAGHTRPFGGFGSPLPPAEEFTGEFNKDIMPFIESHYLTKNDRRSRAIAGLSMGGFQTLNVAIQKLDAFAYIGVYSSGLLGIVPMQGPGTPPVAKPARYPWEEENLKILDDATLKKELKLFWFATGKEDFLLSTTKASVDLFKKHGFAVEYKESGGGHTWLNWQEYLSEFAPRLFQ